MAKAGETHVKLYNILMNNQTYFFPSQFTVDAYLDMPQIGWARELDISHLSDTCFG